MALLPLIYPITSATAYFGGIRMSMWTWSCTICPSTMVLPRCPASSRNTGPRKPRILPYSAFFRPFGIKTTLYLQSHFEWLRLSYDDVVLPFAPCGPPSPQRAYDNIIFGFDHRAGHLRPLSLTRQRACWHIMTLQ